MKGLATVQPPISKYFQLERIPLNGNEVNVEPAPLERPDAFAIDEEYECGADNSDVMVVLRQDCVNDEKVGDDCATESISNENDCASPLTSGGKKENECEENIERTTFDEKERTKVNVTNTMDNKNENVTTDMDQTENDCVWGLRGYCKTHKAILFLPRKNEK